MTLAITHTFVSGKADGVDATLVQPSNWNAVLTTSMATGKVLGRSTAGAGAIEELTASTLGLTLLATATADGLAMGVAASPAAQRTLLGLGALATAATVGAAQLGTSALGMSMTNGTFIAAVAGSALTIALKTLAGTDPTAIDPVFIIFRDAAAATGGFSVLTVTAATSLVISSGSTMGFGSGAANPGRLWIVGFNDAGTFRLGAINCRSGTNIYPLSGWDIASSTAEGGAGAADSAQVFYTGAAVTAKAYSTLAYMTWETGLTAAGTWDATPTRTQLFSYGVPLPGTELQSQRSATGAVATGTTVIPYDDTIPQSGEGDQYMSQAITPSSAANILDIEVQISLANNSAGHPITALFQDATAGALVAVKGTGVSINTITAPLVLKHRLLAALSTATTFKVRAGYNGAGTTTFNGESAARLFGGVINSYLGCRELMA